MAKTMTAEEVRRFMRTGSRTGKLATVCADGRPHVVPIWFDFDDATGDVVFLTSAESIKGRNLRRDPRASLLVDEETMPFAWAKIDGTVTLSDGRNELIHWGTVTCRRYVGDEMAEQYGRRNGVPGELVVRLTPQTVRGETGVAD